MPYSYSYEKKDGYLSFLVGGTSENADMLKAFALDVLAVMRTEQCFRSLLNERELAFLSESIEIFESSEQIASYIQGDPIKVATIYSQEHELKYKWLEAFLRSRKLDYRVFQNKQAALNWLLA